MSGIVAIIRTDGAEVAPAIVRQLISSPSLVLRGPDRQDFWHRGPVALGHSLLRTTFEAQADLQPLSLDGEAWIVADGRVDARAELIAALSDDSRRDLREACDSELMLRAYLKWGEQCVDHLLGDFSFAVWNQRTRVLFCARDHMGVKPFYYVHRHPWLLVSSTIESLRLHPAVSKSLNDLAIADFLLFGCNQEGATTCLQDILRLPAAHTMTWSGGELTIRRYWTLPIEDPVYYRRTADYLDQFSEIAATAVSDRLRTDRVGVLMSGGLDSSSLAVISHALLGGGTVAAAVRAFTFVYEELIPDDERAFATAVAESLDIPITCYVLDEARDWAVKACPETVEPMSYLLDAEPGDRCYREMAVHSRVAFYGEGPDNAMHYEVRPHLARLLAQRRWGRFAATLGSYLLHHRRVPSLSTLSQTVRNESPTSEGESSFPSWLSQSFVDRLSLRDRWSASWNRPDSPHPVRPRGYRSLQTSQWQTLFESLEPSYTKVSLEVRHPYVDVRMLRFMLRLPPIPWCRERSTW